MKISKTLKRLIIVWFLSSLVNHHAKSQDLNHFVYLTMSNNGQLGQVADDFYFQQDSYNPADDVNSFDQSIFKFNFHYEYLNKSDFLFRFNAGYGERKDNYVVGNQPGVPPRGQEEQSYISFSAGFMKSWELGNLRFSTGLEIPFYILSDCVKYYDQNDPDIRIKAKDTTEGGLAFGFNSTSSLKWLFSERVFLSVDFSFGVLRYQLGGERTYVIEEQDPQVFQGNGWERENSYNRTSFSQPEAFFGVGVRL